MCGIVGIVGRDQVSRRLVAGLKRLEYRGYDSAGLAVMNGAGVKRLRAKGKIVNLELKLDDGPIDGHAGIAHTRWATHGAPTEDNAHPHKAERVTVVHNGIIENYAELRDDMGHRNFQSETDTEVVAHLIDEALKAGAEPKDAFSSALKKFRGAYALGVLIEGDDDAIYCARAGSPLAIGIGDGERYLGSDAMALAPLTEKLIYLEEGDWAILRPDSIQIFDIDDNPVERDVTVVSGASDIADKGQYPHYMLKEIHEQPGTAAKTLAHFIDLGTGSVRVPEGLDFSAIDRVVIVACGTAFYAGMVAKYAFEQIAGLAVDIDIASEFRYRSPVLADRTLFIAVSQSGETADTLAALRYCQAKGHQTAALVNVMTSTMAREADVAMPILAGPEIGVASTKAFTSQVIGLSALAVGAAVQRATVDSDTASTLCQSLAQVPEGITHVLALANEIERIAHTLTSARSAFFLGRGAMVPIAFEGALKLKEISYIHAEGYAAGELKHGPIALIEEGTPVIVLAPHDELYEKTMSNLAEVAARGARVILVTDQAGARVSEGEAAETIIVPDADALSAPLIQTIAVQLLSYYTAVALGTDVDQPRNLAKSVTVE